ncbi:putative membrane protein [Pseudomonas aeruginosa]|nr:putative membrane protein [Pseudomonas aeruginosa]
MPKTLHEPLPYLDYSISMILSILLVSLSYLNNMPCFSV